MSSNGLWPVTQVCRCVKRPSMCIYSPHFTTQQEYSQHEWYELSAVNPTELITLVWCSDHCWLNPSSVSWVQWLQSRALVTTLSVSPILEQVPTILLSLLWSVVCDSSSHMSNIYIFRNLGLRNMEFLNNVGKTVRNKPDTGQSLSSLSSLN